MNLDRRLLERALSARLFLFLSITFGFLGGILIVWRAYLFSQVVDRVFLDGEVLGDVVFLLAKMLVVFVLLGAIKWGMEVASTNLATHVKLDIRQELYNHILALGPIAVSGGHVGGMLNLITEGIDALDVYYQQYLPQLVLSVLVPLTYLFFIFPLDALSAVILLLTAPLIPVFMILIGNIAEVMTKRQWRTLNLLSAYYFDVLQGLTTLKVFGRSREQIEVIAKINEQYRRRTMGVLRITFLSAMVLELVSTLSTAIVAVEIGLRLLYGRLAFEEALFVLLLAPEFYLPLRLLGTRFHAGLAGLEAAKRIFAIFDQPVANDKRFSNTGDEVQGELTGEEIRFHDVCHNYDDSRPSLQSISFVIKPGETVALVGPNGAGKSTVANLLLRFIEPSKGQISLGNQLLTDLSPPCTRERFAWVPQSPFLFNDTVLANIQMARPESTFEDIVDAARLAHAHAFIERLPRGYNTVIGEDGSRLSAGEAQRISIARAFLKDSPYLILDEMTSNLDPENEALISDALETLVVDRSVLIIAHRLRTVYQADNIILLNDGQIEAIGTHDELLETSKRYRYMIDAYTSSDKIGEDGKQSHSMQGNTHHHKIYSKDAYTIIDDPLEKSQSAQLGTLRRLLNFLKPYYQLVFLSVTFGFATIASGIGLMTSSAYLISAAALQPSIADLQVVIVAVRFFGIARGLFRYLERLVSHQVTFHLLARLRVWFYQHLEPLAPARIMYYKRGDLISRAMRDINSLENFYVRVISPPLVAILVALCTGLYLWFFSPILAINLLLFLIAAGVLLPAWTRWYSRDIGAEFIHARAALSVVLVDGIQGMADLLAYGQERKQITLMIERDGHLASIQKQMAQIGGVQSALESLFANLGMWMTLTIGIYLLSRGQIDSIYLASLALAALASFEAVEPLPVAAQYLESNLVAGRRLLEIVDAEPEVEDPPRTILPPRRFDLEVRSLWFRYPEGRPYNPTHYQIGIPLEERDYTLEDISFSLPKGACYAVVGPSGSGKSTIVNLLLRFWDYGRGEIYINGRSIRSFSQEKWRENIGIVSQKTHLFNGTIRDNLQIARPGLAESEIVGVAKMFEIHDFIQTLPNGYDTWVGERGMRLSGGERQKIAIMRGILKDAPLLILDEATAHLDPITERQILSSLLSIMNAQTLLMITHRIAGLDQMDEILVLDHGRIVERGRHYDLLQSGGLYRKMWDIQNQLLREV